MHILLIIDDADELKRPEDRQGGVCGEIPDPELNAELHEIVSISMIQGPRGELYCNSPCIQGSHRGNHHCTKNFPKPFCHDIVVKQDAFREYWQ